MAIDSNMKSIIGLPFKLLLSILCLKCNYINACVVTMSLTMVEKTLMKPVKKGQMEVKRAFLIVTGLLYKGGCLKGHCIHSPHQKVAQAR